MDLHVRYEGDDDPEKCTARALARFGLVELHRSPRSVPRGIVLDPHAERALSPADGEDHGALVALDCSWETADAEAFRLAGPHRALPFLVAGNPVSHGTPFRLNTAEAIMSKFRWGHTFLELNAEPLERYAACADSTEVVAVQEEYLDTGSEGERASEPG